MVSCDLNGCVYLLKFIDDVLGYSCIKKCFYRQRLGGPAYSVKPLFYDFEHKSAAIGAFTIMDNPYTRKDKDLFEVDVGEELAQ